MACIDDVYVTQNPLWNEQAEQSEAAYGEDFDTKVGIFDSGCGWVQAHGYVRTRGWVCAHGRLACFVLAMRD